MDLKKIKFHKEEFVTEIRNEDILKLENGGNVCGQYFEDSKTGFDIIQLDNDKVTLYIGNFYGEYDEKVFYEYSIILSNGNLFEGCFWNFATIPFVPLEELSAWKAPRMLNVKIKVGLYWGPGRDRWFWTNILTKVEDFEPVCSPSTFHTNCMDGLLKSAKFSDVTLICPEYKQISAHRNLLLASPYFCGLFGSNFGQENKKVVKVENDFESMQIVVSFLYTGRVEEEEVINWPDLYQAASFYQVNNLARHCELQMMSRVTKEWDTIKELIKFARTFHAIKLKKFLINFARKLQQTA